jgi:hypothetical protein
MSRRSLLTLALSACCALMLACAGADNANTTNTTNLSNANRSTTNAATTTTPATSTSPAASTAAGDKIGVAECDDYLAKVDDCVTNKVPAAAREQYAASIKQTRDSWRGLAANPQTRSSLAAACKQAVESARAAYKSYGCEF